MHKPMTEPSVADVSVVIPCFNCADTIYAALESVRDQTLPALEIITVDDASSDETVARLQQFKSENTDFNLKIIQQPINAGPSAARNAGWDAASGRYVAFLDADDSWHLDKLRIQYSLMAEFPNVGITGHAASVVSREQARERSLREVSTEYSPVSLLKLLAVNQFPTLSVMLKRELPHRFAKNFRRAEDFYLWSQIIFSGVPALKIEGCLAYWHKPTFGIGGLSGDIVAMTRDCVRMHWSLHKEGLLSMPKVAVAIGFDLIKFVRQWVLLRLNRV